jgi:hypothetical protein
MCKRAIALPVALPLVARMLKPWLSRPLKK